MFLLTTQKLGHTVPSATSWITTTRGNSWYAGGQSCYSEGCGKAGKMGWEKHHAFQWHMQTPTCGMEYHHTPGDDGTCWLDSAFEEKDPTVLLNKRLAMSRQLALWQRATDKSCHLGNCSWLYGNISSTMAKHWNRLPREDVAFLYSEIFKT